MAGTYPGNAMSRSSVVLSSQWEARFRRRYARTLGKFSRACSESDYTERKTVAHMLDLAWFSRESRVDVYPNETEPLDIAIRADSDAECYGWNDDSYRHHWRNPHWKLNPGCYLVRVVITSSGQRCAGVFHLKNDGSRAEFALTLASPCQTKSVERVAAYVFG
jgi:hypothetical protein